MIKLAFVVSHPIQYYSPLLRQLAASEGIVLKVFYTWSQAKEKKFDPGFGKEIEWDIPLLEGYEYEFIENTSKRPGSDHFQGIINPGLIKAIGRMEPDLLLVVGWNFQSHLQCMRHFSGKVPILFRGDSTLLDEQPGIKRRLRRIFLTWVYRHIDFALYTGQYNKEYFLAHGIREQQLVFAPHAVENERFAEPDAVYMEQAVSARRDLGIAATDLVVLFAGKLEPKKNPLFLVRLAKAIPDADLKFLVVGNGVQEAELRQTAASDKRFIFAGFRNQREMPVVYRTGDVLILPSLGPGETWGLAVNEAMASRRAVIVSDKVGCSVDLVQDGVNGLIIRNDDAEGVIALLKNALGSRSILVEMGRHSGERIERFHFSYFVQAIYSIIEKVRS